MVNCMRGLVTSVGRITDAVRSDMSPWLGFQARGLCPDSHGLPLFPGFGLGVSAARLCLPAPGPLRPLPLLLVELAAITRWHFSGSYRLNPTFCWKRARALLYLLQTLATLWAFAEPSLLFCTKTKGKYRAKYGNYKGILRKMQNKFI